jgi:translation initiation factor 4A
MNLPENLLRGIYGYGFEKPSVVQQRAIVPLGKGLDVIAQSQSGTGKTGAFSIGLLQRIDCQSSKIQALILEPTRDLANQSFRVISTIGEPMGVAAHVIIGGTSVREDLNALRKGVNVVVGTPGRLLDHISRGSLRLDELKVLILDEADEMLSAGFLDAMRDILNEIPPTCQIGLFSATMPPETLELTERFMKNPLRLVMNKDQLSLPGIDQYYVDVGREEWKFDTIVDLFDSVSVSQCVIFCNTRRKAVWLKDKLAAKDFPVDCMHSEMPQAERNDVMAKFYQGNVRVLIATDLIARGIDAQGVGFVVNFDLTKNFENHLHRIGRGGRFGRRGVAINFITSEERNLLSELCAFYSITIEELPQNFAVSD